VYSLGFHGERLKNKQQQKQQQQREGSAMFNHHSD
jgi:hypothetical protein